ncbi:MAG: hypothetical protein IKN72_03645 [Clostridia bacterium]|nr:hypothetical protein [Clostridia bacterium]
MKILLTDAGRAMLLAFTAGSQIEFTRVVIGNGDYRRLTDESGDPLAPQIVSAQKSAAFESPPQIDTGVATLTAVFNNSDLETGFHVTEIGYYATLDDGEETLYAVGNADERDADYIPAAAQRLVSVAYEGLVYIGDADVSAVLSENAQYTPLPAFEAHLRDKSNPHDVTAEQVGLGLVPNVRTDDQTPGHALIEVLENLKSGERLSVALGKIKLWIDKLIQHLGTKSGNPHGVTLADVGGASKTHTHAASDVTVGVFPLERGGTGLAAGASFKVRETKPSDPNSSSYGICYGSTVLPGGLLVQWGRVNVDGHSFTVNFAKEYANENYALVFPSCGSDFIPVWKNPTKTTTGFTLTRSFGADSAGLKGLLKKIFVFVDASKIDELFGASQAADWIAVGQAK